METDIIAAGMFLVVLRFIKYLRVIPGWGPMLLAVVDTLKNATVLLYLAVMMGLQLACAFAFNIAFGADNNYFSSITRSFTTVFKMVCSVLFVVSLMYPCMSESFASLLPQGFSMNDDDYLGWSYPRAAVTIFFFLHVLLSIVLLNLFIGMCNS